MYLLFDIGGTQTRLATSTDGQSLINKKTFPTPAHFADGVKIFESYKNELEQDYNIVVGGLPGGLNDGNTELLVARNLPEWVGHPISESLGAIFKAPVLLHNDAVLAGLGEAVLGSGVGYDVVAYITISTGVGGVRIENGKIDEEGLSYKVGLQIIDESGNDLEELISGKNLAKRFGITADKLTDQAVWDDVVNNLAQGLVHVCQHWQPDVVVLGGGVTFSNHFSVQQVTLAMEQVFPKELKIPPVLIAKLGDDAGLYGALEYAKQQSIS